MLELAEGRIEFAALGAHEQIEAAPIANRRQQGNFEPEGRDLAKYDVIDQRLEAEFEALVPGFEKREIDIVLSDAISLEQRQAIGKEGTALVAGAAAITGFLQSVSQTS